VIACRRGSDGSKPASMAAIWKIGGRSDPEPLRCFNIALLAIVETSLLDQLLKSFPKSPRLGDSHAAQRFCHPRPLPLNRHVPLRYVGASLFPKEKVLGGMEAQAMEAMQQRLEALSAAAEQRNDYAQPTITLIPN